MVIGQVSVRVRRSQATAPRDAHAKGQPWGPAAGRVGGSRCRRSQGLERLSSGQSK